MRKIGEKALTDIFRRTEEGPARPARARPRGGAGERTDDTKPYEFGDPFLLDMPKTVMNAVQREGAGVAASSFAATISRSTAPSTSPARRPC